MWFDFSLKHIREIDQYGFERDDDFDYESYESFMAEYLSVLARRLSKWEKYLKDGLEDIGRSNKSMLTWKSRNI